MFEVVSQGFRTAKNLLKGKTVLTESNIDEALKEVRLSLLEADVQYHVVKRFLQRVRQKAIDVQVRLNVKDKQGKTIRLTPAEHFIGICYEELESLLGGGPSELVFSKPIGTILMAGLQGSGKTTTTGKLALFLQKKKYKPLLVAADIYRPAAVLQLQTLGKALHLPVFSDPALAPPILCQKALQYAKEVGCNVVLFDTAGRLTLDETLMKELESIKTMTRPDHIFLVLDAMIGQDAVNTATAFNDRLDISGCILTKLDGDTRGGVALSVADVTQKPIQFVGMGEKMEQLEEFRPQGLASRILGMGDVVSLVKDFETHVDEEQAQKDAEAFLKGNFNLQDFLKQLRLIKKMGSLQGMIEKLPGLSEAMAGKNVNEGELVKWESLLHSMTIAERVRPELMQKQVTRRKRIAQGAGRKEIDVQQLLQRFSMMRRLFDTMGQKPSLMGQLPGFKQMGQIANLMKAYGGGQSPLNMMENWSNPFSMTQAPVKTMPAVGSKNKKDKRKREKIARKKNKKKK